jgi:hypothetical protein
MEHLWKEAGELAPADRESRVSGSPKSCNQQLVRIEGQPMLLIFQVQDC